VCVFGVCVCMFVCVIRLSCIFCAFNAKQIIIFFSDEIRFRMKERVWVWVWVRERDILRETEGCDFFPDYISHC